jgi:vancomycin permeability regulator SanA
MLRPWVPVPLSALVTAGLIWIVRGLLKTGESLDKPRTFALVGFATFAALVVALPLAQMLFFGTTDYRRPADVAVVPGARAYADGTASQALSDRVRTAVELYHQGLVTRLIFSGGPGDGDTSEPQAMRRLATDWGVPPEAIVLDEAGVNTDATVKNTASLFASWNVRRVLVVSHAYHLPRVKLAYQRAGWDVRTVPARQTRRLRGEMRFVAREVAAVWVYYLRPILS